MLRLCQFNGKKIFGSYATKTQKTTGGVNTSQGWKRIEYSDTSKYNYCAGDFVEVYNYGHSIFITKVDSNYVYYVDCNWIGPCQINWNGKKSISAMQKWTSYIVRMDGNILKGTGTPTYTLSIKYNSNGASLDCKQYITAYALNLRSSYSTSSSKLTLIPEGKIITVSETKTAGGYTWGKTTYDSKTGWCALSQSSDVYAYKRFYLNSSDVYLTKGSTAFSQNWTYGNLQSGDLYNYTTFGMEKEGYSFVGWCASADGSTTIFGQDEVLKAENICADVKNKDCTVTLYAIWAPNIKAVSKISLQSNPNKTTYYLGDTFDPSGLSIQVDYTDGSSEIISQEIICDYNFSNPGTNIVFIEYQDAETDVEVTVLEPVVSIVENSVSLAIGEEKTVMVLSNPDIKKSFVCLDETVATVDLDGKISGKTNGTTELMVEILYNNTFYSDVCTIVVGTGIKEQLESLEDASIIVESKTSRSGEIISLPITLNNADTLKSIALSNITYNENALELIDGEWKLDNSILSNVDMENKTAVIAFGENIDCNGEIFVLIFKVNENVADGYYTVSCDITAKHKSEMGEKEVAISSASGGIEVVNIQKGDVNGDDEVNSDDAIHLLYFTLLPDLYPINQDGDFDGNDEVNSDDAIYLLYYTLLPDFYPLR